MHLCHFYTLIQLCMRWNAQKKFFFFFHKVTLGLLTINCCNMLKFVFFLSEYGPVALGDENWWARPNFRKNFASKNFSSVITVALKSDKILNLTVKKCRSNWLLSLIIVWSMDGANSDKKLVSSEGSPFFVAASLKFGSVGQNFVQVKHTGRTGLQYSLTEFFAK